MMPLLCLLVTACTGAAQAPESPTAPTPLPVIPLTPTPQFPKDIPLRKAWFYKPPGDGNLSQVAKEYSFFIMSKGDELERDQLLALGAKKPIFQYVRFDAIMDPGDCQRKPWQNNAAYLPGDFCQISAQHPDWFLLDHKGRRIVSANSGEDFVMMDPGNTGWRAFFLERIRKTQDADKNWGGVFLDNVEVTTNRHDNKKRTLAAYPDETSYQAAVQGFLQFLRTSYFQPTRRLLFANLIARKDETDWSKYLTYLDGAMHEGWSVDWPNRYRSVETWEAQMTLAEQTQAMGKFIILVSQGKRDDLELQKFAFASYLLINQGRSAFRYANSQSYDEIWLYDTYKLALGEVLGDRFRDGDAWRRNFTHGFVRVNPKTHEAQINIAN